MVCELPPCLAHGGFHREGALSLIRCLLCICWDDHMGFAPSFDVILMFIGLWMLDCSGVSGLDPTWPCCSISLMYLGFSFLVPGWGSALMLTRDLALRFSCPVLVSEGCWCWLHWVGRVPSCCVFWSVGAASTCCFCGSPQVVETQYHLQLPACCGSVQVILILLIWCWYTKWTQDLSIPLRLSGW